MVEIIEHAGTSTEQDQGFLNRTDQTLILLRDDNGAEIALDIRAPIIPGQIWLTIAPGNRVEAGDRIGLIAVIGTIRLYLPAAKTLYKSVSQRVMAGETVMAVATGPVPGFRTV